MKMVVVVVVVMMMKMVKALGRRKVTYPHSTAFTRGTHFA